uniref:Pentapeptide repeat-containing protein n=1 Tax=Thalassionema nitzschioides TaxID=33649 RepID=A0A7S1H1V0_9STRA|mmetsp:Transcript_3715/g.3123  ORF Transcript_3715/g.3123 Transcript_3715/m.3123 type:complete len:113 (+) Transcript_3715:136-474(+)
MWTYPVNMTHHLLSHARILHKLCVDSNFDGADFTNAIVDRASFQGSSLRGAIFANAVLTGTSFKDADVENADFTEAYIGDFDIRNLCKNPTLKGENSVTGADTRLSAGCSVK